ncbi:Senescence-induced receptor-like serine/threonine-protein kinase [Vitis vinifera]|uniref:Senescence-induced receptor-like serine/threonine-protein kinase n=1 Tax=Vitis vinifera TaxID=29760 RepID=A0A438EVY5_VITVI|nr:Senescence-induced receptor-like serine/threonine-protein kinase [Vitis vinifera]RVX17126.1 Senescence-induced receptor-like serine/threonine-protein kinase [Vitis vinifera]
MSADENEAVLSWEQRVGIAIDVAQGLDYLHHSCTPPIIHGNIKSANILLNEKLQAKVADFGLSRSVSKEDSTYSSTMAVDPYGYLDPE